MIKNNNYISVKRILECISVLFIIYWDSLYFSCGVISVSMQYACLIIMTALAFKRTTVINKNIISFVFLPCLILALGVVGNRNISMGYISKAVLIVCGYYYTQRVDIRKFSKIYIQIMCILSLLSVVMYFISNRFWNALQSVFSVFPIINRNKTVYFHSFGFTNVATDLYSRGRNYGIFQEPGAFAMFICLATLLLIRFFDKGKWFKFTLLIFSITMLTTLSTSGILCYVMILVYYLLKKSRFRYLTKEKLIIGLGITTIGILFICSSNYAERIFSKLFSNNNGLMDHSFSARIFAIRNNISIFMNSPLWGVGPENFNRLFWENGKQILNSGVWLSQTNTILGIFAIYGGLLGAQFAYLQFRFAKMISDKVSVYIFLILILLLIAQDYEYSILLHTIGFYGLFNKGAKKNGREIADHLCTSI